MAASTGSRSRVAAAAASGLVLLAVVVVQLPGRRGDLRAQADSLLAQAIGACALAALTTSKKPYPRALQRAAIDVGTIPALVAAFELLGPAFDQPVRAAVLNISRGNPETAGEAIRQGADAIVPGLSASGGGGGA